MLIFKMDRKKFETKLIISFIYFYDIIIKFSIIILIKF